jgi:hypothetical protein
MRKVSTSTSAGWVCSACQGACFATWNSKPDTCTMVDPHSATASAASPFRTTSWPRSPEVRPPPLFVAALVLACSSLSLLLGLRFAL